MARGRNKKAVHHIASRQGQSMKMAASQCGNSSGDKRLYSKPMMTGAGAAFRFGKMPTALQHPKTRTRDLN
jgi:hypothetical protein